MSVSWDSIESATSALQSTSPMVIIIIAQDWIPYSLEAALSIQNLRKKGSLNFAQVCSCVKFCTD